MFSFYVVERPHRATMVWAFFAYHGGMGEYAPDALVDAGRHMAVVLGGTFSGVVGDKSHTYGYHRSRNALVAAGNGGDYSLRYAADKTGDGDAASAIDITLPAQTMITVSKRLIAAGKRDDARGAYLREFFGTVDGRNVSGWDFRKRTYATSDSSHLWHIHLSVHRRYATSYSAAQKIVDLVTGKGESTVKLSDRIGVPDWVRNRWSSMSETISVRTALASTYGHARAANDNSAALLGELRELRERVERLESNRE